MKIIIDDYIKNIPTELKKQKIWGLWDLEERDGRTTKVPYNAMTNQRAKSNDPSTWCDFEQAITALKDSNYKGLAIFLGGGLCGLDVDHVDAELSKFEEKPNSDNLVNRIKKLTDNSYMEVSQSGAGIHVLFKGLLPKNVNNHPNNKPFELYDHGRFFALTGNLITNKPEYKLLDGEQVLDLVNATVGFKEKRATTFKASNNDLSVDEIIKLASDKSTNFKHLMTDDPSSYSDHSSADMSLCNILAFWTNKDPIKMDTIFRQSSLYRPKWDEKRRADGTTYGQMTIQKAIEDTSNGYTMNQQRNNDINLQSLADTVNNSGQMDNIIPIDGTSAKQPQEDNSWRHEFIPNENGTIKSTAVSNAVLILNNDPNFKGLFRYNDFTHDIEVSEEKTINLNGYGNKPLKFPKGSIQDIDNANFGIFCEKTYNVTFKPSTIDSAILVSARQNSYNPVIDYMEKAKKKWDGKQRLDELFPVFLGADDNETTRLITELWFMGGVAKAYNPLTKIDTWLDLVGGQGTGKTTLLQRVAPMEMYTDQFDKFEDKDAMGRMVRAFIINDDEMDASNKCGFAEVKKFSTAIWLQFRPVYMKHDLRVPKGFIMARTTNDKAHLRDTTGDRRFMTILVNAKNQKKKPYKDLKADYVLQLWGEAVHLYESFKDSGKNPFELNDHQEALLKANSEQFKQTTGLQDEIENAINDQFAYTKIPDTKQNYIIPSDLAKYIFNDESYFAKNRKVSSAVNNIMETIGYKKDTKKVAGKPKKCFIYTGE